jgi:hypothetical protein
LAVCAAVSVASAAAAFPALLILTVSVAVALLDGAALFSEGADGARLLAEGKLIGCAGL